MPISCTLLLQNFCLNFLISFNRSNVDYIICTSIGRVISICTRIWSNYSRIAFSANYNSFSEAPHCRSSRVNVCGKKSTILHDVPCLSGGPTVFQTALSLRRSPAWAPRNLIIIFSLSVGQRLVIHSRGTQMYDLDVKYN